MPDTWSRVVITAVAPEVEGGAWPVKRGRGETVDVTAGIIADGHEDIAAELLVEHEDDDAPTVVPMEEQPNDEFTASFEVERIGTYTYWVRAWVNRFGTWQDQFARRVEGGEAESLLESELKEGAELLRQAAERANGGDDEELLTAHVHALEHGDIDVALQDESAALARKHAPREGALESTPQEVLVDPEVARSGAWYEFFPRSARSDGTHATFDDAAERLPRIKEMGFDIVYLPPIHPIGETHRKGKDNAPTAEPGEPGSPWAIGGFLEDGTKGGHKSVHPALGGIEAFDRFVARAEEVGLKVALDIAFQTSPDHPYVEEHPEWFYHRPDGSIRYAENPPKKYQDVYPINFENEDWRALWQELKSVFEHWIDHGVTIFRVDNPHTKPFAFWEWCLASLREDTPELIVLSEAFTKPKTMHHLAKLGFNNSYTYFTWRNTKKELQSYAEELFHTNIAEFFRPNFWPNTPDILHDELVHGGRPAHITRFVLAATLSSAYGVYGPPFEHLDNNQHPDREEYANNEKYEIRTWDWNDPTSLQPLMQRVNAVRKANPALQQMRNIRFLETHNDQLMAYTKWSGENTILVVTNLDPHQPHEGLVELPLAALDLPTDEPYHVEDLLSGAHYTWQGTQNYVKLTPSETPAHIFRLHHKPKQTGEDFIMYD
jgi:starch synthase (maltosyl-transferring)